MSRLLLFFSFLISLVFSTAAAQDVKPGVYFYYRQLDNRNGLSNSSINAIYQDKDQLLWVGTWDGLNRYYGAHFNVYNHNIDQKVLPIPQQLQKGMMLIVQDYIYSTNYLFLRFLKEVCKNFPLMPLQTVV